MLSAVTQLTFCYDRMHFRAFASVESNNQTFIENRPENVDEQASATLSSRGERLEKKLISVSFRASRRP